jgi:hypothetical protein
MQTAKGRKLKGEPDSYAILFLYIKQSGHPKGFCATMFCRTLWLLTCYTFRDFHNYGILTKKKVPPKVGLKILNVL